MPVLILLLVLLALAAFAVLAWPLLLWLRLRAGTARRRANRWALELTAWLAPAGMAAFLLGVLLVGLFVPGAFFSGLAGLLAGMLVGVLGWTLTRVEHQPGAVWYTPNRWLVLALTLLLFARILAAIWQLVLRMRGQPVELASWGWLGDPAGLFAVAGVLVGYHAGYAWMLRWRLSRWVR